MKHTLRTVAAAALAGGALVLAASPQAACAQRGDARSPQDATVRLDTVLRQDRARGAAPASVQAVRRRIQQIGSGRKRTRRVIYPVIVVPSYAAAGAQQGPPASRPGAAPLPPRAQRQLPYYFPGSGARLRNRRPLFYNPYTGEARILRRDEDGEELVPLRPDSAVRPVPVQPPSEAPRPTVRRIERAILEAGLFRASNVNFEFDESTLLPASENTLNAIGDVLARYPALRIAVEGHTDATGPEAYNQTLSERRAASVARYLSRNLGIGAGRLDPVGFGESRPVASNETATGRTLNRRVTFRVLNPEAAERYLETEEPTDEGNEAERDSLLRETIREAVREGMKGPPGEEPPSSNEENGGA